jgi:hypothetical protein
VNGIGTAKQVAPQRNRRIPTRVTLCLGALVLAGLTTYFFRSNWRKEIVLLLQPDFTVTKIDGEAKTLTLSRAQESLIVSCGDSCGLFRVGKSYGMLNRGSVAQFRIGGQKVELPILQQHFEFETPPGGHG